MNTHAFLRDSATYDVEELGGSNVERLARGIAKREMLYRGFKAGKAIGVWADFGNEARFVRVSGRHTKRFSTLVRKIKYRQTDLVKEVDRPQSVPSDAGPRQGQLSLQSRAFHPSTKLLSIWRMNIRDLANEGGRKNVELRIAGAADFELARQFVLSLEAVLGALAQYLRHEEHPRLAITNGTRFAPSFQVALCEEFKIIPDQAYEFLRLLNSELRAAFEAGWEVRGNWGKVEIDRAGDLYYGLRRFADAEDPNFVEAVDEEL